ncbi:serine/threonine-protein kinase [Paraliomyxa miuraensis]|uniref:serine/threonine-protein kinase n=1 Tax=Paraliomyxa miuraensis TaxID=376150 RepID=UPI00225A23E1|nr:serine/threonine-protein kinase [Paraliomyxa miuraensis]MCX4243597.1 tetratricopeptide repeat protein [Paraliomyxa miuraensis]
MDERSADRSRQGGDSEGSESGDWRLRGLLEDLGRSSARGPQYGWDMQKVVARTLGDPDPTPRIGRFVVTGELGRGNMGAVVAAHDEQLGRTVAIKLMTARGAQGSERFEREARAMARLSHPNVVQVHDVGWCDGTMYIAMEHVQGQTLREWTAKGRPWAQVLRAFVEAGQGLAAAHAQRIVHRDFKPDNVMVGDDGRVRVLDFGLARAVTTTDDDGGDSGTMDEAGTERSGRACGLERVTAAGTRLGSPAYMAPEQLEGREVTPASDQWAFCVALYEGLFGVRPFVPSDERALAGDAADAILREIIAGRRQPPTRGHEVPRRVLAAVVRGLELEADARWPSMDALLDELRAVFRGKRLRLVGAGALLGLVPAVVAAAWMLRGSEPEPCAGLEARARGVLPGIWDDERKAMIERAFEDTGVAYARQSWSAIEDALDGWVTTLGRAQHEACLAHRVRGEQSAEAMDLRMACLERQQAQLAALWEVLVSADAAVVERAPRAMLGLPEVEACEDVERLRAEVRPPADEVAEQVELARAQVEQARALLRLGRYHEGLVAARRALEAAERSGYRPVASEARAVLGELEIVGGAHAEGVASLERAARDGVRDRHDALAAESWSRLARYAGGDLSDPDAGRRWWLDAQMLYERVGLAELEEVAWIRLQTGAKLDSLAGDLARAEDQLERAVELARRAEGSRSQLRLAETLDELAIVLRDRGRHTEAVERSAEALELNRALLGPDHPVTARTEYNIASALRDVGRFDEARAHYERALQALAAAGLARSLDAGRAHVGLAGLAHDQGRLADAIEHARRAEQILPRDHPEHAAALEALGVLHFSVGELEASVAAYERAIALYERAYGPEHGVLALTVSNLGESLVALGRFEHALPLFERADRMIVRDQGEDEPDRLYPLKGRGLALLGLGQRGPAAVALRRAWQLSSPSVPTERGEIAVGLALALEGDDETEARALAREARRLLSDEAGVQRMKGLRRALGAIAEPFDEIQGTNGPARDDEERDDGGS